MTTDEAIIYLRSDPQYAELIRDSYLEEDARGCAERFTASEEFAKVRALLDPFIRDGEVLDLGAGTGIASYALARCGAKVVYALEPDPSDIVGRGVIRRLSDGLPVKLIESAGEEIPLPDASVGLVYARQVLHHTRDLTGTISECARVLRSGGKFFASREPVVDDDAQLKVFLDEHPVHRLAGGENAFPLDAYIEAIRASGLKLERVLGPYDTIINAYPELKTVAEVDRFPRKMLDLKFGRLGAFVAVLPGVKPLVRARLNRYPTPGRLYSFLASKP
ncbi:MAG TPA: class I SAM-dependent methyltransferase [Pyrinomonadaceae bacterium]|jgi:SAM-dependent methyltransferase|nr:class I SAM-dependent methyltransferase [Pyrinomonadaceae bacterium]